MASVLVLSLMRASRTRTMVPRGSLRRPIMIAVIGFSAFSVATLLTNYIASLIPDSDISTLIQQALIFLPSFFFMLPILYGVLFEFSQSSQAMSSDMVNWLPIRTSEYVVGSALSTIYITSPFLLIGLGATLGLALNFDGVELWSYSMILCLTAVFTGAFVVEVVRGITNRVSSVFYRRGGRSAMALRLVVSIAVFVVFMLFYNINFLTIILKAFVGGLNEAWFIPAFWPSLALVSILAEEVIHTVAYTALSIGMALAFLWAGLKVRERYWVPMPVSIKISTAEYAPRIGILGRLGYNAVERAIIRKDLRSLVRRREMTRFLAFPIVMTVIMFVSTSSAAGAQPYEISFFVMMAAIFFPYLVSLISIGQEGEAVWTIYSSPITEKELVKAKVSTVLFPSIVILFVLLGLVSVLIWPGLSTFMVMLVLGFSLTVESALIGLALGARFPDFRVVPRSRFITFKGGLLGFLAVGAAIISTISPMLLHGVLQIEAFNITMALLAVALVAGAICYVAYRSALSSVVRLFREHPT